jgi:hypothetical protein
MHQVLQKDAMCCMQTEGRHQAAPGQELTKLPYQAEIAEDHRWQKREFAPFDIPGENGSQEFSNHASRQRLKNLIWSLARHQAKEV